MINYDIWLKYTNRQDNKKSRLEYFKNYLYYIKMQEINKKVGKSL